MRWLARARWPLLGIALLLAALWWLRAPIADYLLPRSTTERLLAQAEQALMAGRLRGKDGAGALEGFNAVLARDPDHAAARAGLERVARAALAGAEHRLEQGDQSAALALLDIARAAGAPGAQVDALLKRANTGQSSEALLMGLLDAARRAQAQGNLDGDSDSALARFNEILERDPGNVLALNGRDDVLAGILAQAHKRLDAGDGAGALALIEHVDAIAPRHLGLPAARAALASHLGGVPAQGALRRAAIMAAIDEGQLDAAQTLFDALSDLRPADEGLVRELASAWARRAIVEALRERDRASQYARNRLLALNVGKSNAAGFMALVDGRMAAWHTRRDSQASDDDWSMLFAALQGQASDSLTANMRQCFEQALASIWLERAATCLEAMSALVARADAAGTDRARLAKVYVGVAEERLGRGNGDGAWQAANMAQLWDPGAAGLEGLFVRLGRVAR
ncbi:MAG: hypothetical protein Q8L45_06365 [Xanthomonadaceae bacterium]|nr:hypothetical protein [Xanthomonadaceae bacterium]MDP2186325.1 hypothetical protein [Xanthomonadales bacterium]MDZ4115746.1 hypothetical protein [Xanthomonadaceae bacterium]MDZ4379350.1 hypothetical protein [Xanthomonadaceae bacterium]